MICISFLIYHTKPTFHKPHGKSGSGSGNVTSDCAADMGSKLTLARSVLRRALLLFRFAGAGVLTMPKPIVRRRKRLRSPTYSENALEIGGSLHDNLRLQIQYVAPVCLTPPQRILRKHSKRQITSIGASIRAHGFLDPILINSDKQIICGYGR